MDKGIVAYSHHITSQLAVLNGSERLLLAFCLQHYDSRPEAITPSTVKVTKEMLLEDFPRFKGKKPSYVFNALKSIINGMQAKPYIDPEDPDRALWWFNELRIGKDMSATFSLNPKLNEFFLELGGFFMRCKYRHVVKFKYEYSWALYDKVKEKLKKSKSAEWVVTVEELREICKAHNVHKRDDNFITYCVKKPFQEISEHCDVIVSIKKIKTYKPRRQNRETANLPPTEYRVVIDKKTEDLAGSYDVETPRDIFLAELSTIKGVSVKAADELWLQVSKSDWQPQIMEQLPTIIAGAKKPTTRKPDSYVIGSIKNLAEGKVPKLFETPKRVKPEVDMSDFSDEDILTLARSGQTQSKKEAKKRGLKWETF